MVVAAVLPGALRAAQAVREDVREAHHHRGSQVARLQPLDDLVQVNLASLGGIGPHDHVAGLEQARCPGHAGHHRRCVPRSSNGARVPGENVGATTPRT